ncbi:hypothetical protein BDF14DRAFT_1857222 [Spinellus fusiger]|nr:hypothetical protein BDF14DRAFT_1857222 [Spinellus fusiger]
MSLLFACSCFFFLFFSLFPFFIGELQSWYNSGRLHNVGIPTRYMFSPCYANNQTRGEPSVCVISFPIHCYNTVIKSLHSLLLLLGMGWL